MTFAISIPAAERIESLLREAAKSDGAAEQDWREFRHQLEAYLRPSTAAVKCVEQNAKGRPCGAWATDGFRCAHHLRAKRQRGAQSGS